MALFAFTFFAGGGSEAPAQDVVADTRDGNVGHGSSSDSPEGIAEGIGVRGDWEVTVLNEDGSVAGQHAFHNDLTFFGQTFLARVLSGEGVIRQLPDLSGAVWLFDLDLEAGSFSGQCPPGSGQDPLGNCSSPADTYFGVADAARDGTSVVLTAETEQFAGPAAVETVATVTQVCTSEATGFPDPVNCSPNSIPTLTQTDIEPVAVEEGQRILLTVTISFTTG